jgi:hypothetical protein
VFAQVPPEPPLTHAIMDKGYDSKSIREQLLAQDIVPVIPPKSNRIEPIDYDKDLYKLNYSHLKWEFVWEPLEAVRVISYLSNRSSKRLSSFS